MLCQKNLPLRQQRFAVGRLGVNVEVRGQFLGRCAGEPIGQQQGVEFGRLAVVEGEEELTAVRSGALQRVRQAGGGK
jgi:hypothetical protein